MTSASKLEPIPGPGKMEVDRAVGTVMDAMPLQHFTKTRFVDIARDGFDIRDALNKGNSRSTNSVRAVCRHTDVSPLRVKKWLRSAQTAVLRPGRKAWKDMPEGFASKETRALPEIEFRIAILIDQLCCALS
jgi:hypothetical protein